LDITYLSFAQLRIPKEYERRTFYVFTASLICREKYNK